MKFPVMGDPDRKPVNAVPLAAGELAFGML